MTERAVIKNWRMVKPTIAHGAGIDWRLMSMPMKTSGDIDVEVDPESLCLKTITYVSLAWLQPGLSYEPHIHDDHEELYYVIKGRGKIRVDNDINEFCDGDLIYIPVGSEHEITNEGSEMVEFLAFGGYVK
ncbi:MAG: cupin domain-containing protein [Nitrososphaeria archaeon]|nr:cupin domain-containing protein [Nitrososphaeria archaeon]NIQ33432.1 cupin domain-containing protein [Nitrososphaeria archaeon]